MKPDESEILMEAVNPPAEEVRRFWNSENRGEQMNSMSFSHDSVPEYY